ncbi:MAG: hypothetical protein ACOX28_04210 [Bacilli bacterium]|jgi:hypothetical protein
MKKCLFLLLVPLLSSNVPKYGPSPSDLTFLEPFTVYPVKEGEEIKLAFTFYAERQVTLTVNFYVRPILEASSIYYGEIRRTLYANSPQTIRYTIPTHHVNYDELTRFTLKYQNNRETRATYRYFSVYPQKETSFTYEKGGDNIFKAGTITKYNGSTFDYIDEVVDFSRLTPIMEFDHDLFFRLKNIEFSYFNSNTNSTNLSYRYATLYLYDVADIFPKFKPNFENAISFYLMANRKGDKVYFSTIMTYYVNRATGYLSPKMIEGYSSTRTIYFPKNKLTLNKLYKAKFIIGGLGQLSVDYTYDFEFMAKKPFLGEAGAYQIVVRNGGNNA